MTSTDTTDKVLNKRLINSNETEDTPIIMPGKQTSKESKERILQAAVKLFARQGYGNTGLRELSKEAGVNLAMINYFFGSKKALLKEILDIFFTGYLQVARSELSGKDELACKLRRFIHSSIAFFTTHRDYLLVTISELPHDDPEITEYKANWGKQMVDTMGVLLDSVAADSSIKKTIPPVIFCSTLMSMMASRFLFNPVMEQVQPRQLAEISDENYADIISTIFLHGIEEKIQIGI